MIFQNSVLVCIWLVLFIPTHILSNYKVQPCIKIHLNTRFKNVSVYEIRGYWDSNRYKVKDYPNSRWNNDSRLISFLKEIDTCKCDSADDRISFRLKKLTNSSTSILLYIPSDDVKLVLVREKEYYIVQFNALNYCLFPTDIYIQDDNSERVNVKLVGAQDFVKLKSNRYANFFWQKVVYPYYGSVFFNEVSAKWLNLDSASNYLFAMPPLSK